MKLVLKSINISSKNFKIIEWIRLISITGGTQAIVQAISLVSGILVIRLLPTQEYAMYTLANTMLGTMVLLADGGITSGVTAQGGKVWQDRVRLGIVFSTGLNLRRKFALGSLIIAVPLLLYLLRHHGASWLMSLLIVLALIPAFISTLSSQLLSIIPKLHQDIAPLQKIQVGVNIGRLIILGFTIFIFPWASVAILAAGLPQIWGNTGLTKISAKYAELDQKPDPTIQNEIGSFVKRLLPGVIYYCISGQITIWLISIFGSTTAVAQVGALGRLAMILSIFTVLFSTLITPRFARMPVISRILLTRYLQIQIGFFCLSISIIATVWLFSNEVLWILGKEYSHLRTEVVLNIIGSCLGLIAGSSFSLYISRGWSINPIVSISLEVIAVLCGVAFIDISSLKGILLLNIFIASTQIIKHNLFALLKIKNANS